MFLLCSKVKQALIAPVEFFDVACLPG